MSVRITYFVHGTTTDNEADLATGQAPGELSVLGIEQAKELGTTVADTHFDAVFCSDLKRAVDSAVLGFADKYEIIQDKHLRECDDGDYTGRPVAEFKPRFAEYIETPFPNGESLKDVEHRIADFLDYLKQNYESKHIAIVAHEAPQLALDVLLRGRTWQEAIAENWRLTKSWQPGWEYELK